MSLSRLLGLGVGRRAIWLCLLAILAVPGASVAQGVPQRTASEVVRIGGIDAPEPAQFQGEPYLVASPDGGVFARSVDPPHIAVFDAAGRHLRTIGREGRGPGEFTATTGHGLLGDTLWVINLFEPRASFFRPDGSHITTDRLGLVEYGVRLSGPQGVTHLLSADRAITVPGFFPLGGRQRMPVYVGDYLMVERRAVAEMVLPGGSVLSVPALGIWGTFPFPFPPIVAVSGNGLGFVIAEWDDGSPGVLRLARFDSSGDETWRRALRLTPVPVGEVVRDSLIALGISRAGAQIETAMARGEIPRQSVEVVVREGLYLPDMFPPTDHVVIGVDGSIWLRRAAGGVETEWLVLDSTGVPAFTTVLRSSLKVQAGTMEWAWATERGAFDVPYLVRVDLQ